jgi:hypothetical protein
LHIAVYLKGGINMGMYTELILGARLRKDTPKEVIDALHGMIDGEIKTKIDHPFFAKYRARILFRCSSFYFGVNEPLSKMWFDEISKEWAISTRSNIKNYDGEIEAFIDWIKPYIASGSGAREMFAVVLYEEDYEPTIYYKEAQ